MRRFGSFIAASLLFALPALAQEHGAPAATPAAGAQTRAGQAPQSAGPEGAAIYAQRCANCHDFPSDRIPPRTYLSIIKTPDQVVTALSQGLMKPMADGLTVEQIRQVATHLTGRPPGQAADPDPSANMCRRKGPAIRLDAANWNGWGIDSDNSRFQRNPGLRAADVPRLKVKWVFAYPGAVVDGQPVYVSGRLFVTSRAGRVFSLDAKTGCTYWTHDTGGSLRTAVTVGAMPAGSAAKFAAYFTTEAGFMRAVDAETGTLLWETRIEDHPITRITGSPTLYKGKLYQGLSSLEELSVRDPSYQCCTFRGGVVAVDATTGKIVWKSFTIDEAPKQIGTSSTGTKLFGPAGATTWMAPTIDAKRNLLYVGTGNSYTQVSVPTANAILALDLDTGKRAWAKQIRADDDVCPDRKPEACESKGPDLDFSVPPILRTLKDGKQILLGTSKAGDAWAFDPDQQGQVLWHTPLHSPSAMAGSWGPAADDAQFYVNGPDLRGGSDMVEGGLAAVDIATGAVKWLTPAPPAVCSWKAGPQTEMTASFGALQCTKSQPAGLALIPGVVFSASIDGHVRAFDTRDGKMVWQADTGQSWDAVNGAKATGGSISNGAQAVAGGMLFVNSGAAGVHQPGNALIAFSIDGK